MWEGSASGPTWWRGHLVPVDHAQNLRFREWMQSLKALGLFLPLLSFFDLWTSN